MEQLVERITFALQPNLIYLVGGYETEAWRILACKGLDESRRVEAEANIPKGLEWKVKEKKEPIIVPDTSNLSLRFRGISSALVVPMIHGGEVLGALYIGSEEKETFTDSHDDMNFMRTQEDLRFVTIMAGFGAAGIRRTRDAISLLEAARNKAEVEAEAESAKTLSRWTGHAVKNAIWIIAGRAKLLRETAQTDEERKPLDVILRQARKADYIAEKFRYASMKSEIHRRRTDLHKLIASAREEAMMRVSGASEVEVQEDCDEQIGEVEVDPVEMKEALFNLMTNALKAMPQGGTLTLETKQSNDCLTISVRDTGRGISEENQKHLFNPFFSTTSGGLGLGLWLTKRIVENHNGEIQLDSREGEGTTVTIRLPLEGGKNSGNETTNPDS